MSTATIPPRVHTILSAAEISECRIRIPQRLNRHDYAAVNRVLTRLGGVWSRKDQAHIFPADPAPSLSAALNGAALPPLPRTTDQYARTAEGYVSTPDDIANMLVRAHTGIGDADSPRVLEPSAGDGQLVRAILAANPHAEVTAVEPNQQRAAAILTDSRVSLSACTFEEYAAAVAAQAESANGCFDAVAMNPPFSVLGHPTIWIDHLRLAWELLKPGGRLAAIVPAGYVFRMDKRHTAIRELITGPGCGGHAELPDDTFDGTRTVVVWADKPLVQPESADRPRSGQYRQTPADRAERTASDRELNEHVTTLLNDPHAVAQLDMTIQRSGVSAKIHGYSSRNQALLLTQCAARGMALTDVDTVAGWRTRGRSVRSGVAGLRISAPRGTNDTGTSEPDAGGQPPGDSDPAGTQGAEQSIRFRMISVFETSQTEPNT